MRIGQGSNTQQPNSSVRMHELSVAQSIAEFTLSESDRLHAKKVRELHVYVGELMQVDKNVLIRALEALMTDARLKDCRLHVQVVPASFTCRRCSSTWGMKEAEEQLGVVPQELLVEEPDSDELPLHFLPYLFPAFIHCPKCGSSDISAVEGEDVRIGRIVLE